MTQAKWLRIMCLTGNLVTRTSFLIDGDQRSAETLIDWSQKLYSSHSQVQVETYLHSTLLVSIRS
jgi:hypothetical protein